MTCFLCSNTVELGWLHVESSMQWPWARFNRNPVMIPWFCSLKIRWLNRLDSSILKVINPDYSLEGLMLKLKLILWPHDVKRRIIGKDPDAGKDQKQKKRAAEGDMVRWHHQLNDLNLSQLWGIVKDRKAWHASVPGVTESQTQLSDWKTTQLWIGQRKWNLTGWILKSV